MRNSKSQPNPMFMAFLDFLKSSLKDCFLGEKGAHAALALPLSHKLGCPLPSKDL